jgi:ABC-type branched-subunit amino acid transport system substrate-binding protein
LIQRGDSWGDGIRNIFEPAWTAKGGRILGNILRYPAEYTDFTNFLSAANMLISNAKNRYPPNTVGGVLLAFDEASVIITQAQNYPAIYSTKWFGTDSTAKSLHILEQASIGAEQMKIFSLLSSVPSNQLYSSLESRYTALTNYPLSVYGAYLYDTAMVIMRAMLQADSIIADDIVDLLPTTCNNYWGASGACTLNEADDRVPPPFDIWGYGYVNENVAFVKYGSADPVTGLVTWDASVLGYTPP